MAVARRDTYRAMAMVRPDDVDVDRTGDGADASAKDATDMNDGEGDVCGICDCQISLEDRRQIIAKKLARGYCLTDSYAVRAFQRCCKEQHTENQMDTLKVQNPDLWKGTVIAFRDQRSVGKGTKFDVLRHLEATKKAFVQDSDDVYRPLLFGAYLKHFMELPAPLHLTEAQATAQWYSDLQNPKIKKSEKKYYNPKSKQDEAAWT